MEEPTQLNLRCTDTQPVCKCCHLIAGCVDDIFNDVLLKAANGSVCRDLRHSM